MIRIEIIANVELQDTLENQLKLKCPEQFYSILPVLSGHGKRGYAQGDVVWPDTNFYCLIILKDDTANVRMFKELCDEIQENAPLNSITIMASKVDSIML